MAVRGASNVDKSIGPMEKIGRYSGDSTSADGEAAWATQEVRGEILRFAQDDNIEVDDDVEVMTALW